MFLKNKSSNDDLTWWLILFLRDIFRWSLEGEEYSTLAFPLKPFVINVAEGISSANIFNVEKQKVAITAKTTNLRKENILINLKKVGYV